MKRSNSKEESVKEWINASNALDRERLFAILAPDFVVRGVMGPQGVDRQTFWKVMVAFRKTFPDIKWELGRWLVSDHDLVVCQLFESGTFKGEWANPTRKIPPTNRHYRSEAVMFFRFDSNGLIVENQSWYDSVDWFHQIGVDPNMAFPADAQSDSSAIAKGQ